MRLESDAKRLQTDFKTTSKRCEKIFLKWTDNEVPTLQWPGARFFIICELPQYLFFFKFISFQGLLLLPLLISNYFIQFTFVHLENEIVIWRQRIESPVYSHPERNTFQSHCMAPLRRLLGVYPVTREFPSSLPLCVAVEAIAPLETHSLYGELIVLSQQRQVMVSYVIQRLKLSIVSEAYLTAVCSWPFARK